MTLRATWTAVAAAEALLAVATGGLVLAVTSVEFCIGFGCDGSDDNDALVLAGLVIALLGFGAAPYVAARLSGWASPGVVAMAAVAAFVIALVVAVPLTDDWFDDVGPALVVAVALLGGIAVRSPSGRAIGLRVVLGGLLVAFAFLLAAAGLRDLVAVPLLLVLPAFGLSDTLDVLRARERDPEPLVD